MKFVVFDLILGLAAICLLLCFGALAGYSYASGQNGWAVSWAFAGFILGLVSWVILPPVFPRSTVQGEAILEKIGTDEDEQRFRRRFDD